MGLVNIVVPEQGFFSAEMFVILLFILYKPFFILINRTDLVDGGPYFARFNPVFDIVDSGSLTGHYKRPNFFYGKKEGKKLRFFILICFLEKSKPAVSKIYQACCTEY